MNRLARLLVVLLAFALPPIITACVERPMEPQSGNLKARFDGTCSNYYQGYCMDSIITNGSMGGGYNFFCDFNGCVVDCTLYPSVCDELLQQGGILPIGDGGSGGGGGGGSGTTPPPPPPNPLAGAIVDGNLMAPNMTDADAEALLTQAVVDCTTNPDCNNAFLLLKEALKRDLGTDQLGPLLKKFTTELMKVVGIYASADVGLASFTLRSHAPGDATVVEVGRILGAPALSGGLGVWWQWQQSRPGMIVSGSLAVEPAKYITFGIDFEIDSFGHRYYNGVSTGVSNGVGGSAAQVILNIPLTKPVKPE